MALTHAIYDLCAMPQYIEPMRSEAQTALAEGNGEWTTETIKNLRRLDSFLKESQRVNQSTFRKLYCFHSSTIYSPRMDVVGFDRKVISPITLSDVTTLPRGTTIAMPGGLMARDSAYYSNPETFNSFRFFRPDEESTKMQQDYTGIEPGNLSWGSGRFTCPGRWYAAVMIKMIMAKLLLEFDISFPDGQKERPANGKYDTEVIPDMKRKIVLTRR
jgi:hypothetical protein